MEKKKYRRLSEEERIKIEVLLQEKRSANYIAKVLGRHRSTISREIRKWVVHPTDKYNGSQAHFEAVETNRNKTKNPKLERYAHLRRYVYRKLLEGISPELISGRLSIDYPNHALMSISHEAIYQHIYRHPQARINRRLIRCLLFKKTRRRKRYKGLKVSGIKNRTSIDLRPGDVELRIEFGHLEADLIVGRYQSGYICSIVERKTRFTCLFLLPDKKAITMRTLLEACLAAYPALFKKSLTYDNGTEMAEHELFTQNTGIQVYFAHPYSSWERGTNENTNGLVRRHLPKKTDFSKVSLEEVKAIEKWLNDRPRKVLGFLTPREAYNNELAKATDVLKKTNN